MFKNDRGVENDEHLHSNTLIPFISYSKCQNKILYGTPEIYLKWELSLSDENLVEWIQDNFPSNLISASFF